MLKTALSHISYIIFTFINGYLSSRYQKRSSPKVPSLNITKTMKPCNVHKHCNLKAYEIQPIALFMGRICRNVYKCCAIWSRKIFIKGRRIVSVHVIPFSVTINKIHLLCLLMSVGFYSISGNLFWPPTTLTKVWVIISDDIFIRGFSILWYGYIYLHDDPFDNNHGTPVYRGVGNPLFSVIVICFVHNSNMQISYSLSLFLQCHSI